MTYALNLAEDGRVLSATYPEYAPEDAVKVEALPEGDVSDYLYVDGEFICDPQPKAEVNDKPTPEERIAELEEALALLLSGVTE